MAADSYFGNKVVQESGSGDITDIRMIQNGNGFTSLPTLTITSTSGNGAKVLAYGSEIGRALTINVIESGHNYQASPAPTVVLPTYILCTGVTGTFSAGETVTGAAATSGTVTSTVVSFDTDTQVLKLSGANGTYGTDITIFVSHLPSDTLKILYVVLRWVVQTLQIL